MSVRSATSLRPPPVSRSVLILIVGSSLTVIAILSIVAFLLIREHHSAELVATRGASNIVQLINADVLRNVELYDLSLKGLIAAAQRDDLKLVSAQIRHLVLFDRSSTARFKGDLLLLDKYGNVIADSSQVEPKPGNFADRDYFLTHAFNGMPGLHHRDPGPVGAALVGGAYLEVILDGHHVHPAVVAMLFTLAPHRIVLVTDAMAAAAAPDGQYLLGGLAVEVEDRVARLRATGSLAGSTLTLDAALRHALEAGIPVVPVIEALTLAPARVLGLSDSFGLVRPGFAADLVLFDHAWQVTSVLADGAWLHRA